MNKSKRLIKDKEKSLTRALDQWEKRVKPLMEDCRQATILTAKDYKILQKILWKI